MKKNGPTSTMRKKGTIIANVCTHIYFRPSNYITGLTRVWRDFTRPLTLTLNAKYSMTEFIVQIEIEFPAIIFLTPNAFQYIIPTKINDVRKLKYLMSPKWM